MTRKITMGLLMIGAALAAPALAQQTIPDAGIVPATTLDGLPHKDISNGIVSAKVYLPGENGFYRGTRFDRSGVVAHATYKGQDYGQYWFSAWSPDVHDFTWRDHKVIVQPASAIAGPAEEFDQIGFEAAPVGGTFFKPGIGMLKKTGEKYDHVMPYPVVNEGTRTSTATKTSVRLTQDLSDKASGFGYHYVKTVRLVPGKAQMQIEHVLKNTGTKDIVTSVYCHNFLSLATPGNDDLELTAPFDLHAGHPFRPGTAEVTGRSFKYLRPIAEEESVTSPISGFGTSATDYDFKVVNTKTGFGQRIRGDQPLAQINFWSIRTTFSWEPYVAISLKPGESKSWTYTYDYFGPGEH